MNIPEAIQMIRGHQKSSKDATIEVVRKVWNKLQLSNSDITALAQQALSQRTCAAATGIAPKPPAVLPEMHVNVHVEPYKTYNIDVRVLYETDYDINGKRVKFIQFTLFDLRYMADKYRNAIEGYQRHLEVILYTQERLIQLGKKSVSDLAQGEQTILSRKLEAAIQGLSEAA